MNFQAMYTEVAGMRKGFRVHACAVHRTRGVTLDDDEPFLEELVVQPPMLPGLNVQYLNGDRGEQVGKYLLVLACKSAEPATHSIPNPINAQTKASAGTSASPKAIVRWTRWLDLAQPIPGL